MADHPESSSTPVSLRNALERCFTGHLPLMQRWVFDSVSRSYWFAPSFEAPAYRLSPIDPPCRFSCSQFRVSTTGDDLVSSIHDYQSSAIGSTLLDHAHHSWDAVHQLMRPTRFANDECYMDRSFSCDVMCVFDLSARSQDVTSFQRSNCACFIARLPPPSTGCVQCKLIRSRNIAEPEN